MTDAPAPSRSARSGCAVISGVLLISIGSLFLTNNILSFMGISSFRVGMQALVLYGAYWPLLFIAWGAFKILERFRHPERSYVTAAEIVILAWILVLGLVIRGAGRVAEEIAEDVSLDDFAGILGPELLGPLHRDVENEAFDLGGASVLVIDNEHGEVVILGSEAPTVRVNVAKQINSYSDADVARAFSEVKLEFSSDGERARLRTSRGDDSRGVRTDLEIRVPRSLSISLSNGRGSVRLEGLAAPIRVETAHGDVTATDLSAGIDVETSHATIRLDRLSGPIVAVNQQGAIHLIHVEGNVTATTEHGSVTAEQVSGNVVLRTEHGSVRVADISGEVEIASPYSEVSVERARASVSVAAGHRPIFVHDVAGGLEVVARSARMLVRGVALDVSIESRSRPVNVADVRGDVSVIGEQNAVDIDSVEGAITIQSSHEDVHVSNFNAGLSIRTSHANVDITASQVTGTIEVETSYGNVSLALPNGAAATLLALTRDGRLRSEFPELMSAREGNDRDDAEQRWVGVLGSGVHPVTLTTSYGDIALTQVSP